MSNATDENGALLCPGCLGTFEDTLACDVVERAPDPLTQHIGPSELWHRACAVALDPTAERAAVMPAEVLARRLRAVAAAREAELDAYPVRWITADRDVPVPAIFRPGQIFTFDEGVEFRGSARGALADLVAELVEARRDYPGRDPFERTAVVDAFRRARTVLDADEIAGLEPGEVILDEPARLCSCGHELGRHDYRGCWHVECGCGIKARPDRRRPFPVGNDPVMTYAVPKIREAIAARLDESISSTPAPTLDEYEAELVRILDELCLCGHAHAGRECDAATRTSIMEPGAVDVCGCDSFEPMSSAAPLRSSAELVALYTMPAAEAVARRRDTHGRAWQELGELAERVLPVLDVEARVEALRERGLDDSSAVEWLDLAERAGVPVAERGAWAASRIAGDPDTGR